PPRPPPPSHLSSGTSFPLWQHYKESQDLTKGKHGGSIRLPFTRLQMYFLICLTVVSGSSVDEDGWGPLSGQRLTCRPYGGLLLGHGSGLLGSPVLVAVAVAL